MKLLNKKLLFDIKIKKKKKNYKYCTLYREYMYSFVIFLK